MQLLIGNVSELKLPERKAEIKLFFDSIGYQLTASNEDLLSLTGEYAQLSVQPPVTFQRYDQDRFLSIRSDGKSMTLPYAKALRGR
ncbi:hypothetical protein IWT25_01671 [Secundilactobacillus pentosiphilus]|uniref:Uncharacterized protein n=1 Tax=Secundilactobacillus pentosiphilus TaxID=1714682 RepID=A0A1Z5IXC1_9LACO|nr:hypothetical protein [Secundilactobacillus pentosiphilus]GAX06329.1 hypothetical protein IWT25_01671 [Secundilactobacillus pentosiphilus]